MTVVSTWSNERTAALYLDNKRHAPDVQVVYIICICCRKARICARDEYSGEKRGLSYLSRAALDNNLFSFSFLPPVSKANISR